MYENPLLIPPHNSPDMLSDIHMTLISADTLIHNIYISFVDLTRRYAYNDTKKNEE